MRKHLPAAVGVTVVAVTAALLLPSKRIQKEEPPEPEFVIKTQCAPGAQVVCDALDVADKKKKYKRLRTSSTDCVSYKVFRDGGVESLGKTIHPHSNQGMEAVFGSCREGGSPLFECACASGKKPCQYATDAGFVDAPKGKTLGPDYPPFQNWTGEGCVPKPCVELFGSPSWPAECPR